MAGCGGGEAPKAGPSEGAAKTSGPEKTKLTVGIMPIVDLAPFYIAKERGLFAREGLDVQTYELKGSAEAVPRMKNGTMDVSFLDYISAMAAQDKGAIDLRLIADSYHAVPGTFLLMSGAKADIKAPADLKGKTIAVATLGSIATLGVEVLLKANGMSKKDVKFTEVPLPQIPAALAAGTVDAGWMVEPFITVAKGTGAKTVADLMSGETDRLPIATWGVTAEYAQKNPRTVEAFRRVITEAQRIAASDEKLVRKFVPTFTHIEAATAESMKLGTIPTALSAAPVQRVADLMHTYKYISRPIDVTMLLPKNLTPEPAPASP
ncbi:ABC transporter substrate-binding protein [Sinosporangium album]|nr:ABC transporter substrate-binding protein [Sinosporangium album]